MSTRRKLVIDCDPGNDDALAILMALSCAEVEVVAITCVEGNTNLKQTGLNALRTLQIVNRLDIPVFLGSCSPLLGMIRHRQACIDYHGSDGFGERPDPNAPDETHLQSEQAVTALLRLSKEHEGELEVVAIGPLTNLALAIRLDPKFGSRLKACAIMGGNYHGRGNIHPAAEFNFYYDPEAAYIVLNELRTPITLLPWETCLKHGITWDVYHSTRGMDTVKSRFMKVIDSKSVATATARGRQLFVPADEAAMACVLNSAVVQDTVSVYATVEVKGQLTLGQVVVDWGGLMKKDPNVTIVTEMDHKLFEEEIFKCLK